MITAKSYFSGAGGMDLGLIQTGINILESYEIDKTCCETLRHNFSHDIKETDITKVTVLDQQDADVYVGTFPCTKYSTAADINGSRTGDDLFLHFFRHVALARPEMYVVENVPGMKKFKVVMEALTKLPDYYVKVICPLNANMWLPQERKRLIVIGTRKEFIPSNILKGDPIKLKDLLEKDPEIHMPDYVYKRLSGGYRDMPIISDPERDDKAPTCIAHYSKDISTRMVKDGKRVRSYTPKEYARLQGFPDDFIFSGRDSEIYKQVGNAVAVPMGRWVGEQITRYFS